MDHPICSIAECERKVRARSWCSSHWNKWKRYGSPTALSEKEAKALSEVVAGEKKCTFCLEVKGLEQFAASPDRATGRSSECLICRNARKKKWASENAEKTRAYQLRYRAANQDVYEASREARAKYMLNWKRAHPEVVRAQTLQRRALKAGASISRIDYEAVWDSTNGSCGICLAPLSRSTPWPSPRFASVDHVIPLSKGGPHEQANLQYACLQCNLRKHTKVAP